MSSDEEYDEYGIEEAPQEVVSSSANREQTRNKNLSTMEADIAAKQRGAAGRNRNTGQVGAFSSAGGASKIDAKLRKAGGGAPSGTTTIVGASAQRSRAPTKFDSVSAAPTATATVTEGGVRSDLTTMEADIAAKRRGRSTQGQTVVGAAYSAGPLPSKVDGVLYQPSVTVKNSGMPDNMEAVKNRERNRELDNLAADVRAKIQAANTTTSRPADPNPMMDAEITRQERQVSSRYDDDQMRNLEEDMRVKSQMDDFNNDPYTSSEREKENMGLLLPPPSSGKSFDIPEKFDDETGGMGDMRRPDDYGAPQNYDNAGQGGGVGATEPLMSQFDQYGETMEMDGEGVQAFLAERKVFDATNVVVAKSDEEEKLDEKKKFRRYLMYGVIGLVLLLIVIVVPIFIFFGKVQPTEAPSAAPTLIASMSPSTNRFQDTIEYLSSSEVSMYEDFSDFNETSAQYRAAEWVANEDDLAVEVNTDQFLQRYILAVFYFSTGGDEWTNCYRSDPRCTTGFSWLRGNKKECQWDGIRCDEPGQVTRILIGEARPLGNNLVGTIPSELGYLSLLSSLTIVGGVHGGSDAEELTGTIPSELGLLTNLNSIYIQAHKLAGTVPNELIENKPNLELLAITRQRLTGPLPTNFAASTKLRDLQFQGNQFTGTIPSEYGAFTTLDNLELKNNDLNGTIPEVFYNLTNVTQLSLRGNNLSGTISPLISQLTDLRFLDLGNNQLTGSLPSTLYDLPILSVVRVQNNQLNGTISEDIALLNDTFRILEGYNNNFSGEMPIAAFESIPRLREVILHDNDLIGNVSIKLCSLSSLKNLTVPKGVNCFDAGCCN